MTILSLENWNVNKFDNKKTNFKQIKAGKVTVFLNRPWFVPGTNHGLGFALITKKAILQYYGNL